MTQKEFWIACSEHLIDGDIALANEQIKKALQDNNDEEVLRLLDEEF